MMMCIKVRGRSIVYPLVLPFVFLISVGIRVWGCRYTVYIYYVTKYNSVVIINSFW